MIGTFHAISRDFLSNRVLITFAFDKCDLKVIEKLKDVKLKIDIKKWSPKKSDRANRYFWELIGELAAVLKIDNWTCYLMILRKYGVFYAVDILQEAYPMLKESYRYTEITDEYTIVKSDDENMWEEERYSVNVFPGISTYSSQEFYRLVEGLKEDCMEQSIDTLPPDEFKAIMVAWKGGREDDSM